MPPDVFPWGIEKDLWETQSQTSVRQPLPLNQITSSIHGPQNSSAGDLVLLFHPPSGKKKHLFHLRNVCEISSNFKHIAILHRRKPSNSVCYACWSHYNFGKRNNTHTHTHRLNRAPSFFVSHLQILPSAFILDMKSSSRFPWILLTWMILWVSCTPQWGFHCAWWDRRVNLCHWK